MVFLWREPSEAGLCVNLYHRDGYVVSLRMEFVGHKGLVSFLLANFERHMTSRTYVSVSRYRIISRQD